MRKAYNPTGKGGFKKGQIANPAGCKPMPPEFKALAKSYAIPALEVVHEILINQNAKRTDRIKAAELIIDRVYGRATQPIEAGEHLSELIIKWLDSSK